MEQALIVTLIVMVTIHLIIVGGQLLISKRRTGITQDERIVSESPASYNDASMITQGNEMRAVMMTEADAAQVAAILNVHAEMQDGRIHEIGPMIARLKKDQPDDEDAQETVLDLEAQLEVFDEDAENLKRISQLFN